MMLGPLRRTAIRLWIILGLVGVIFMDVTIEEFFVSAALSALFVTFGLLAAVVTFLSWKRPVSEFKYFGKPVAGGVAELRDPKFEGAWANVVMPVPYKLDIQEDINIDRIIPSDLKSQWDYFCRQPDYAEAFRAIVCYLASNPQTPAATVRGGHRGASLLEHSFNVWRTMRAQIDAFEYSGMKDRTGKVYFDLIKGDTGQPYRFEHDDPLPYLAAVTHDIGKITCYQPTGQGRWSEVLPEHDSEGAKILRRLRIYEKMPRDEAQRLIVTVGHYHKMDSVPTVKWIDDRCRALINVLYDVDVKTGELEGEGAYDAFISNLVVSRSAAQAPHTAAAAEDESSSAGSVQTGADSDTLRALTGQADASTVAVVTDQADDEHRWTEPAESGEPFSPLDMPFAPAEEKSARKKGKSENFDFEGAMNMMAAKIDNAPVAEAANVQPVSINPPQVIASAEDAPTAPFNAKSTAMSTPLDSSITDDEIIFLVSEMLMYGNSVNGKKSERIAYKHRSWLYIYETDLCKAVDKNVPTEQKEHFGIRQETLYPADSGKHADFTRRLMVALANKGALRQEWNGNFYCDRSAYYWVMPARKNGTDDADMEAQQRSQHVIVCRAFAFGSSIFDIKSCQFEPVIQGCIYQPLTDDAVIDQVKQRMASWTEPALPEDRLVDKKRAEEAKRSQRVHSNGDISKAPFEPSLIGSVPSESLAKLFKRDTNLGDLFAIDEVLKHFAEPMLPARVVELDGVSYYSFSKKGK